MSQKILILGHASAGKDTAAEIINRNFGISYKSSSLAASEIFLYDALKNKYGYQTPEECFTDRVNHRAEWHDLIAAYNTPDPARLAKDILKENDMYIGMRSDRELRHAQHLFDLIIGIYDPRKPLEDKSSFDIDIWYWCDFVIPNSSSIEALENKLNKIFK